MVVAASLLAGLPAASAQATYVASGSDPANDAASPHPGHDIVGVALVHDPRTGQMRAQVRLRGTPTSDVDADLNVFAGRRTATGCNGFPAIGFSTLDTARSTRAVRLTGPEAAPMTFAARKQGGGEAVQEFETVLQTFRGITPNCVIARTAQWNDTSVVYDTAGPYTLRAAPGLQVELGKTPSTMRPGQTRTIRAVLRNPGHARTGRIRLSVGRAQGLSVQHARTVSSIAGGKRRTVSLRVTLSSRAKTSTTLKLRATAPKKLAADAEARLYLRKPSSGGGSGGSGNPTKLCYRYTWYPPYGELRPC